ncbi:hypothetical protein [Massilia scottii]|uniref:hypothetical protein n=1 Tax=Massilia scottii TaxID=3057166 RepID=UPI0027963D45|nr:hypothetical protein [Massilia sp. CCM 9029]MDQ1830787.1 hypothetical protein [Massilia sp. CCM 9029]
MTEFADVENFNTPIADLLEGDGFSMLTETAQQLLEGDLYALAWKNNTARTDALTVRDLTSIEEAFSQHSLHGTSTSPVVGAACCCTCTPACCCTAVSVIRSA